MPEAWCGELRPANPSATPTTHGKLELYCQVFVSSRAATISSFPARRAQDRSPVRQHWESDGPASAPERGGRTRGAVLLSPRSGAGKRRPPATHGSAPWATIFRPSGSAQTIAFCRTRNPGNPGETRKPGTVSSIPDFRRGCRKLGDCTRICPAHTLPRSSGPRGCLNTRQHE